MTMRELHGALQAYYQDYEWYVLSQVNLDDEEDGEHFCGARILSGYPKYLPAIILPCDWQLDVAKENVSEEIKLLVAKIITAGTKGRYPKRVLDDLPWLVELVDRHSYGRMKWSDECPPRVEDGNGAMCEDDSLRDIRDVRTTAGKVPSYKRVNAVEQIGNLLSRLF